jgi:hypothetical protein
LEVAFINAIKNRKFHKLKSFLAEDGIFFNFSKIVFLAKIEKMLSKFDYCTTNYQIAYDITNNPGQKVHQIIFNKVETLEDVDNYDIIFDTKEFQLIHPKDNGKIVLVFTLFIKNGKIVSITIPKKIISKREFNRFLKLN